jgi:hypothetical protein
MQSLEAIYKFGEWAVYGAATKTYLDYKAKKQRFKELIIALIFNTSFSLIVGSQIADIFVTALPDYTIFGRGVAYLSSALAVNIMAGLLAVNWQKLIEKRLSGKQGVDE